MIFACELRATLEYLPDKMRAKRMSLRPTRKGFQPGIRLAAWACDISPTTYARIENGGVPDIKTLIAILDWIEE